MAWTVTLVRSALGRISSISTCPEPGVTSAPAPTTRLPAGQYAVIALLAELVTEAGATCSRPTIAADAPAAGPAATTTSASANAEISPRDMLAPRSGTQTL